MKCAGDTVSPRYCVCTVSPSGAGTAIVGRRAGLYRVIYVICVGNMTGPSAVVLLHDSFTRKHVLINKLGSSCDTLSCFTDNLDELL